MNWYPAYSRANTTMPVKPTVKYRIRSIMKAITAPTIICCAPTIFWTPGFVANFSMATAPSAGDAMATAPSAGDAILTTLLF